MVHLLVGLFLVIAAISGVSATHNHVGTYRTYSWTKDPNLFNPWITLTNIDFETICAASCSNEFRRGHKWCTGYQFQKENKTCSMFPVSKEDVELVTDPANPPTGTPIIKARTEDLGHTSNYVFWSPSCHSMNSAVFSYHLPTESNYYCNASFVDNGLITDKEVEVVITDESPMDDMLSAPTVYVEETDVLVSCCGKFRDQTTTLLPECWAKKINLKNSNPPEKWKGPYLLQFTVADCSIQNVGSKVLIMTLNNDAATGRKIEYFDTTDFSMKTLLDPSGANVYVGTGTGPQIYQCLTVADSKTLLSLGGWYRKNKADVLNVDTGVWSSLPDLKHERGFRGACGFAMLDNKRHLVMIAGGSNPIEFLDWEKKDEWKTIPGIELVAPPYYGVLDRAIFNSIGDEDRACDMTTMNSFKITECLLPGGSGTSEKMTALAVPADQCPKVVMSAHIFKKCFISET